MAIWLEETKEIPGTNRRQASFGMDSIADVPSLPPMSDQVSPGSDAFSMLEKQLVLLDSNGIWQI